MRTTGIIWFKNDLRTQDNNSLFLAMKENDTVLALYCFDPRQFAVDQFGFKKTEKFRAQFLIETIQDLRLQLQKLHIPLFVYFGKPETHLPKLVSKHEITSIYLQKEWTQEERACILNVKNKLPKEINWKETYDQFLFHPEDIPIPISETPLIFTNFRKKCEKHIAIRPLKIRQPKAPSNFFDTETSIPDLVTLGLSTFRKDIRSAFPDKGGSTSAWKRIEYYFWKTKKLSYYKKTRNGLVGTDYSSKFSPWLANGSISARQLYYEIKKYETSVAKNDSTYWLLFELIWRDFFKYVSLKHGNSIFYINGLLNKHYEWTESPTIKMDWINGNTASDFVNANMIELQETGWMSNRGRQNVASYFAKELQMDWRIGASYFESMLLDYDVHSNYGNWLYVAGVGNDPRDRKFNVALQAERYDPQQKFQQLWLQTTLF